MINTTIIMNVIGFYSFTWPIICAASRRESSLRVAAICPAPWREFSRATETNSPRRKKVYRRDIKIEVNFARGG